MLLFLFFTKRGVEKKHCLVYYSSVHSSYARNEDGMKISTRGRYAVRFIIDIASHGKGAQIPLKEVAERQNISEKYLEQIIPVLLKNDIIVSTRGARGGYSLAKDPAEITVGSILRVTERNFFPSPCLSEGRTEPCERADSCLAREIYVRMKDALDSVVEQITIGYLVDKYGNDTSAVLS